MKRSTAESRGSHDHAQGGEQKRKSPRRMLFTDMALKRLKPEAKQFLVWDDLKTPTGKKLGLSVLVSKNTKRFRATYYINGKAVSKKLGKVGETPLGTARKLTAELRGKADGGIDPKEEERKARLEAAKAKNFREVAKLFIENFAKPRQRTWDQTERTLTKSCAAWLDKPIGAIKRTDAYTLLEGFISEGHPAKARKTLVWLRTMWRWAYRRGHVPEPMMDAVELHIAKKNRNPFAGLDHKDQRAKKIDADVKAIWQAAEKMSSVESAFIKLLLLLAPRKTALATMRASHIDGAIWKVPPELTKGYRLRNPDAAKAYITPLPQLAQRILKPLLPKGGAETDFVFRSAQEGKRLNPSGPLRGKLVRAGAPADFNYHAMRHYIATWLEDRCHDEFERALVLNHSRGSVTAGYSHGHALDKKLELLTKWADHVERLVMPKGVKALR
jgi:hypothetical protein